ncbi:Nuclear pore complex protein Nup160 [Fukomys damarensis]|uniref:Nuclear pore complex protein Nup160 n=1 Tax=Fukomys damarensis TaxID=885580 RepID=A0A091E0R9_FUKDA|nr:Nuclear pore complex protein Nup160 [Fukomys damarensis]
MFEEHICTLGELEKQGSCYLAILNCLHLLCPEWPVQPVADAVCDPPGASPKSNRDAQCAAAPATGRCFQASLCVTAISLYQTFKLPLAPVFDRLAFKCIRLQLGRTRRPKPGPGSDNQLSSAVITEESSATEEALRLLSQYSERDKMQNNLYHQCEINKPLSHCVPLDNWLIKLQERPRCRVAPSVPEVELLEEAVDLVSKYVDAALGKGHQYFQLSSPCLRQPDGGVRTLLHSCFGSWENSANSHNLELSREFLDKLEDYQQNVEKAMRDLLFHQNL